jgi:PAS domain S-box-containing protein
MISSRRSVKDIIDAIGSRLSGKYLVEIAFVCAAQFAAGKVGDALQTANDGGIGPVWPASGIALGALLLRGYSVWPGVAAGAFLLAYLSPLPHWAALFYAAGTTLAAVLGVFLLRWISKFDNSLSHLRDALGLIILGAFVSSLVSASVGASILYANLRSWSGLGTAWIVYWLGDSTGVILVVPVALTLSNILRSRERKRITELVVLLVLLIIGGMTVFGDFPLIPIKLHILTFAVLPFVIWAAIRFGMAETALSIVLVATIATVETALGRGPFATNTPLMNAVLLDVFFVVVSVTGLILAAAIAERERTERERERLVRERTETEARLRMAAIVESSEDAIISKTPYGVITSWNKRAQQIFEYTEAEAVGKRITILVPPQLVEEENNILRRLRAGERIEHFQSVRISKTGKKINVSLSISPIKDASGRIVGCASIARDITEQIRVQEALLSSEQQYRLLFERNVAGVAIAGLDGRVLDCNDGWAQILGYQSRDEIRGRLASEFYFSPGERQPLVDELFDKQVLRSREVQLKRKDGSPVWVLFNSAALHTEHDKTILQGTIFDISQRKRSEEALAEMARKLIESQEQERARIARELHDDINQRLALLSLELEQLRENPSEVETRVPTLRNRTIEISDDVRALSHDLHSSKLEYLGVVGGLKSWCKEFGERQEMEIDFSNDVPGAVPLDVGRTLFRLLQEALHNASKHSGVKRVNVQLREESDEIHLIVSDTGRGFDVEAALQGKGLGLTSMRERVRLLNGAISIESKPTVGTIIGVRVPLSSERGSHRTVE